MIVDDDPDFRESLADLLRNQGYQVDVAASSTLALEVVSRRRPSIALVDVAMPGVDGVQLLRYFRSRHVFRQIPVIIVTGGIQKTVLHQLLQLGVKDVVIKANLVPKELIERIELRVSAPLDVVRNPELAETIATRAPHAGELASAPFIAAPDGSHPPVEPAQDAGRRKHPPPARKIIDAIEGLRALPRIIEDLLRLAADPESSLVELEAVVRCDPVVASKVLQQANTAAYSRGAVTQLDEAVRTLGFSNIMRIASSTAVLRPEDLEGPAGEDLKSLWRHSLATAAFAERLASPLEKTAAYLGGLLHDIPSLFILQYLGAQWSVWKEKADLEDIPLHVVLSEAMDCHIEELSGKIISAYRIPAEVGVAIQEYHEFFLAYRPREPNRGARRIDVAHHFAAAAGRPGTMFAQIRSINIDEIKPFVGTDIIRPDDMQMFAAQETQSGLEPKEAELPRNPVPVVFWRDPRWTAPDPIDSILSSTGDCWSVNRIEELRAPGRIRLALAEPGTAEWAQLSALAPVLVLHRGALSEGDRSPGVEYRRSPVATMALIHHLTRLWARAFP